MTEVPEPTCRAEPIWLEPLPDVLLEGVPDRSSDYRERCLAEGDDARG